MPIRIGEVSDTLQERVEATCGVNLDSCYECGKCSGGCPNAHITDYTPRKIIQLIKLGNEKVLLNSEMLWVCVGCQLCVNRCPATINIPRILDYLREEAYQQAQKPSREQVQLFYELMLDSIFKRGRVAETMLALQFSFRSGQYFKDAELGPTMLFKGKMNPFSPKVKQVKEVRCLFKNITRQRGGLNKWM